MGAYLAKGFSQHNLQNNNSFVKPIIDTVATSVKDVEKSFFDTSFHMLRLKYDTTYRSNYSFEENSEVIAYIGESGLQKDTVISNLALNIGEQAITKFYGEALSNAAKSDAVVAERIQGFKDLCLEKGGHLLQEWDASKDMTELENQWLFKPIFWYRGTSIGVNSGVVCLKS